MGPPLGLLIVQHKRIGVGTELGGEEGHSLRHKAGDEGDVRAGRIYGPASNTAATVAIASATRS